MKRLLTLSLGIVVALAASPANAWVERAQRDKDDTRGLLDVRFVAARKAMHGKRLVQIVDTWEKWMVREMGPESYLMISHDTRGSSAPERRVVIYREDGRLKSDLQRMVYDGDSTGIIVVGHPKVFRISKNSAIVKMRTRRLGPDVETDRISLRTSFGRRDSRRCRVLRPCVDETRTFRMPIDS
jgi:hypothetical protein